MHAERSTPEIGDLHKPFGLQMILPSTPVTKQKSSVFALLGFSLALVQFLVAVLLFLPFGMGMFTVGHCIFKGCILLNFYELSNNFFVF